MAVLLPAASKVFWRITKMRRLIIIGTCLVIVLFGFSRLCRGRRGPGARLAKKIALAGPSLTGEFSLEEVLARRRSVRHFTGRALDLEVIGQLAWAGQGVTDKAKGLRAAPSAGAIYPMSLYFATNEGLFVYDPAEHNLEEVFGGDVRGRLSVAALRQEAVAQAGCDIIIAGSVRKVAAKYGSRARRYVLLEAGHIAQNILLQAVSMNLVAVPIGAFDVKGVSRICRLGKELEPFYIICVGYPTGAAAPALGRYKRWSELANKTEAKKAVLIIASRNFRDEELFETRRQLEDAGIETVIASTRTGAIRGMLGRTAEAAVVVKQLNVDDYDAVVFIGGTGAAEYFGNPAVLKIALGAVEKNKVVAAICIAPTILANAGVLQGVRATSFSSQRARLIRAGARYTGVAVERDGLIITGSGPGAARLFGRTIVETIREQAESETKM